MTNILITSLAIAFVCFAISEMSVFDWLRDKFEEDGLIHKFLSCYICQTPYISAIALMSNQKLLADFEGYFGIGVVLFALSFLASIWCALLDSLLLTLYQERSKDVSIIITDQKTSEVLDNILTEKEENIDEQ